MKSKVNVLLFFIAFSAISGVVIGQDQKAVPNQKEPFFQLGVKGGFNFTDIGGESFTGKVRAGYDIGSYAILRVSKLIQVQPELMFNVYKARTSENFGSDGDPDNDLKVNLDYLTIPLLVNITPIKLFSIQLGAQYGVLLNNGGGLSQAVGGVNTWAFKLNEFSALGGIQVNLGSGIKVGARYLAGISNISNLPNKSTWGNQGVQISFGFKVI